ncbi:interleukin-17D [Sylvia borin]
MFLAGEARGDAVRRGALFQQLLRRESQWHGAAPQPAALPGSLEEKQPGRHAARQGKGLRAGGCGARAVAARCPGVPIPLTAASLQVRAAPAALLALLCAALLPLRPEAARAPKQRPARTRSCGERPEELLEQLYGRLAAGMLSAFHHTLQPEPPGRQHNASCPAGARPPADKRVRLPVNLRSASPWAYRISYDPTRYPKYIPEAYCLCKGCLMGIFGEESLHFRSTPVFMPTVILRRTPACAGGRYVYAEDYITIPVGCTCVPEQEKEAESVNSSLDKQEVKLLVSQNKPSSE